MLHHIVALSLLVACSAGLMSSLPGLTLQAPNNQALCLLFSLTLIILLSHILTKLSHSKFPKCATHSHLQEFVPMFLLPQSSSSAPDQLRLFHEVSTQMSYSSERFTFSSICPGVSLAQPLKATPLHSFPG